ncbi:MAG: SGNH/GDSL hydrolase family protein [Candidatus Kapaibacteriota bacterium]
MQTPRKTAINLILVVITGVLLGSLTLRCSPPSAQDMTIATDTLSYLALGDSYTIAERLPVKDSWAMQLAGLVREQGLYLQDPLIIARTGWRTDQLMNAIRQAQNSLQISSSGYDMVSLLIGVNNQYQGGSEELFRVQFASLLNMAITMARGKASRVVVLSIPDYSVTPFARNLGRAAIAEGIERFNAIQREECKKANVAFVDITPLSREALTNGLFTTSDGLHPSREQYAAWAKAALPTMMKALQTK